MAKKRKKKANPSPPVARRFSVGAAVRVKAGTRDPDYPDFPLGGWSGVVAEVDKTGHPPVYLVQWDQYTLEHIHPVYRQRCERDDLSIEESWLDEADLEPAGSELAVIEQPTRIEVRPLRLSDSEDRVRGIFGLSHDDPLPPVTAENLDRYRRHLDSCLTFPFTARSYETTGPLETREHRFKVIDLLPLEETSLEEGLVCQVKEGNESLCIPLDSIEVLSSPAHHQALEDYSSWLHNAPDEREAEPDQTESVSVVVLSGRQATVRLMAVWAILGLVTGLFTGLGLASVEGAALAMKIGGGLVGLIGAMVGWYGFSFLFRTLFGRSLGIIAGGVTGGAVGACLGIILLLGIESPSSTLVGGVLGGVFGRWVWRTREGQTRTLRGVILGALLGVIGFVVWRDPHEVGTSASLGALLGLGAGLVIGLCYMAAFFLASFLRGEGNHEEAQEE